MILRRPSRRPVPPYEKKLWQEEIKTAETRENKHGRQEIRKLETTAALNEYLGWPGVKQVCRISRMRVIRGKASEETVYAITSLAAKKASAADLLRLSRAHWGIENRLHYVRDMSFREDECRVRKGAQALAALRNLALTVFRRLGVGSIPAAMEYFQENRHAVIKLLLRQRIE